ncbi:class I poly(R)-hydroxyalkanoic acid synthase, partial [Acinetobacter baumannii]
YKGPVKFLLAASGHIAGVVNPPTAKKYSYWINDADPCPPSPDAWMEGAKRHEGSWWPEWLRWLDGYSGAQVPAREVK